MTTPPKLVFVGGTGRSGTHIVSHLLGQHSRYYGIPVECRFHCNERGLADLVTGKTTADEFLAKMRSFWWRRVRFAEGGVTARRTRLAELRGLLAGREAKVRGLHKIIPRPRFEAAVSEFERAVAERRGAPPSELAEPARELFYDLIWPLAAEAGKPAMVEMSCFTIASAPGLALIFPEARFVHAVRDGRDSGSSKVSKRQKEEHPTDVSSGIKWWEDRLRLAEEGVRGLSDSSLLHALSLDELVWGDREDSYGGLLDFLGLEDEPAMRHFFETEMSADAAHRERWRAGLDPAEQAELEARYERSLERLEREGYHCAPLLRRVHERASAHT